MRIAWTLDPAAVEFSAIRAQGAGGQNVNKVSNAVHLRFDIHAAALPAELKARLLGWPDARIGSDGVVVIKAQEHRSLPRNKEAALLRLTELIDAAALLPRTRRPTKPTRGSRERRLSDKRVRSDVKAQRRGSGD